MAGLVADWDPHAQCGHEVSGVGNGFGGPELKLPQDPFGERKTRRSGEAPKFLWRAYGRRVLFGKWTKAEVAYGDATD
jgi:hypothetical protein